MKILRSIMVSFLAMSAYFLIYMVPLQRRMGDYQYVYLTGVAFIVIISGLAVKHCRPWLFFSWALLSPVVG